MSGSTLHTHLKDNRPDLAEKAYKEMMQREAELMKSIDKRFPPPTKG